MTDLIARMEAACKLHPTKPWRVSRVRHLLDHARWAMAEGDWIERQFFHEYEAAIVSACVSAEYVDEPELSIATASEASVPVVAV